MQEFSPEFRRRIYYKTRMNTSYVTKLQVAPLCRRTDDFNRARQTFSKDRPAVAPEDQE